MGYSIKKATAIIYDYNTNDLLGIFEDCKILGISNDELATANGSHYPLIAYSMSERGSISIKPKKLNLNMLLNILGLKPEIKKTFSNFVEKVAFDEKGEGVLEGKPSTNKVQIVTDESSFSSPYREGKVFSTPNSIGYVSYQKEVERKRISVSPEKNRLFRVEVTLVLESNEEKDQLKMLWSLPKGFLDLDQSFGIDFMKGSFLEDPLTFIGLEETTSKNKGEVFIEFEVE